MMKTRHAIFCTGLLLLITSPLRADEAEGLIAYWNFDANDGGVLKDQSGHGHDGRIEGNVTLVPGLTGNAYQFDGSKNTYVVCEHSDNLALANALTIEVCIKRSDSGYRWDGIVCKGQSKGGFQLFFDARSQCPAFYLNTDSQGYGSVTGSPMPMNEWIYLAVVYDAAGKCFEIYQNGALKKKQPYEGQISGYPKHLLIGKSSFNAFNGTIDELRIYDRALSADEIKAHNQAYGLADFSPDQTLICFDSRDARLEGADKAVLTFAKTNAFAKTPQGQAPETQLFIYRYGSFYNDKVGGLPEAKLIFQGTLTCDDHGRYEFVDDHLTEPIPVTYSYWLSPDGKNFMSPALRVRIRDPQVWWSVQRINQEVDALAEQYPDLVEKKTFGKTVEGRDLDGLLIGNRDRAIVLVGTVHATESGPELILPALKLLLHEHPEVFKQVGVAALPCVGLDRRVQIIEGHAAYLRKNMHEVDINRNFDARWSDPDTSAASGSDDPGSGYYRGPAPASEPETQALIALLQSVHPVALFSCHSVGSLCNAQFLYCRAAQRDDNKAYIKRCEQFARAYAEGMYGPDYEQYYGVVSGTYYGSLPTWAYLQYNIPAYDLELDKYQPTRAVVYHDGMTPALMAEFQRRHAQGVLHLIEYLTSTDDAGGK